MTKKLTLLLRHARLLTLVAVLATCSLLGPAWAAAPPCPSGGKTFDASRDLARTIGGPNMLPNQTGVDSAPLMRAAISYVASHSEYSKITAEPGDYYFLSTIQVNFGTNLGSTEKSEYAYLEIGGSCLTLALKGASLNFAQPAYTALYINSCVSCMFRDFSIDYNQAASGQVNGQTVTGTMAFTQLMVKDVNTGNNSITFEVAPGSDDFTQYSTPYQLYQSQSPLGASLYGFDMRWGAPVYTYGRWGVETPENGSTTLTLDGPVQSIAPGDLFVLTARGGGPAISVASGSNGATMQNISVYGSGGPAIEVGPSDDFSILSMQIVPRPGSSRVLSTSAGGIELNNLGTNNKVQGSNVWGATDDSIAGNVEAYGVVQTVQPNIVQLNGKTNIQDGTLVFFVDGATGLPVGGSPPDAFRVQNYNASNYQLTLVPDPSSAAAPYDGVFDLDMYTNGTGLVITNNRIWNSFFARGIALSGITAAKIVNNTIIGTSQAGVYVGEALSCPKHTNCAYGPNSYVTISGNLLAYTNQGMTSIGAAMLGAIEISAFNSAGELLTYNPTKPNTNIIIADNSIAWTQRAGIWVGNVAAGVVSNNQFTGVGPGTVRGYPSFNGRGVDSHLPTGLTCDLAEQAFQLQIVNWCSSVQGAPAFPNAGFYCPTEIGPHCPAVTQW
jgi:hypothetical protein